MMGQERDSRRQNNRITTATIPENPTVASTLAELHDIGLSFLDVINFLRSACDAVRAGVISPETMAPPLAVVRQAARESVFRAQLLDAVIRQTRVIAAAEAEGRDVVADLAASTHRPMSR